jgi:lysophospholipase L1-like esterase
VKRLSLAALLLSASMSFAQAPATAPSTRPVIPPPTPEQKAVIDKLNKESMAADKPAPKYDLAAYNRDGTPNPNFGQVNAGFQKQHETFMKRKEKPIGLLFIGDSITAGWGGSGKKVWAERYDKHQAANFGIGGDRTQHVLWRIQEGELDGIKPKVVVLMIGTNNGPNSPEEVTAGVKAIVSQIHAKLPDSKVLLLGIFPRGEKPEGNMLKGREKLQKVNAELAKLDDGNKTRYLEIWKQFLNEDGTLPKEVMPDFLHLSEKGYTIWADSMQPLLDEMMK